MDVRSILSATAMCSLFMLSPGVQSANAASIQADGRRIIVDTTRYAIEFRDGCVVKIANKLTGETCTPGVAPDKVLPLLPRA